MKECLPTCLQQFGLDKLAALSQVVFTEPLAVVVVVVVVVVGYVVVHRSKFWILLVPGATERLFW